MGGMIDDGKFMDKILVTRSSMPPYEEYIEAIKPLWGSHWLTNMGTYHREFEARLKEYLGVEEFSLTVNGHMALELAIQAFGFPAGSEIITTPFTFISTTHAIVRAGFQPVFCDVKASDGTIDETKIEALITEKTVAILPVHVYGNICNVEAIEQIAYKYNLKVIYDAAHAFGIRYKGKGIGTYGDAAVFSFHATKVFNSIEGGGVAFSNHKMYEKLYNLKNFGIRGEELVVEVGANAKMNEFCAIMGLCNLNHLEEAMSDRSRTFKKYKERLADVHGIQIFSGNKGDNQNYSYFPIIINEEYTLSRNELYDRLKDSNIYTRKYFYPLTSEQACFKNKYRDARLAVARELSECILTLPIFEGMTLEQVDFICDKIENCQKM